MVQNGTIQRVVDLASQCVLFLLCRPTVLIPGCILSKAANNKKVKQLGIGEEA